MKAYQIALVIIALAAAAQSLAFPTWIKWSYELREQLRSAKVELEAANAKIKKLEDQQQFWKRLLEAREGHERDQRKREMERWLRGPKA